MIFAARAPGDRLGAVETHPPIAGPRVTKIRETPAADGRATYVDVEPAPEHLVAELIDRALHTQPRPRMRHGRATLGLAPDIAAWRRERAPEGPDLVEVATPPDWVCEVLSPSPRRLDAPRKSNIYAAHGVSHPWLVDPPPRPLTAYENVDRPWARLGAWADDAAPAVAPFDAINLPLAPLWMDPPADPDHAA